MMSARQRLADMPLLARSAVVGAGYAGVAGAVVGLILGLRAYPPTAWFAVIEVAVPSAAAGVVVGLVIASIALVSRKVFRN